MFITCVYFVWCHARTPECGYTGDRGRLANFKEKESFQLFHYFANHKMVEYITSQSLDHFFTMPQTKQGLSQLHSEWNIKHSLSSVLSESGQQHSGLGAQGGKYEQKFKIKSE